MTGCRWRWEGGLAGRGADCEAGVGVGCGWVDVYALYTFLCRIRVTDLDSGL